MHEKIEIYVGDVTDAEARVYARCRAATDDDTLKHKRRTFRGTLRGPYCENVRTLPAEFAFRDLGPQQPGVAEAVVTDPCLWSAELPHLYHVDLEVRQGERVVAEYHGSIGLRRLAPRRPVDFAPGTG